MLETNNITKKYLTKVAVDDISMKLEKGHIYAILGPNGSGKTTWMKMVAGLVKPTTGLIKIDGKDIGVDTRNEIAYMPTEPFMYEWMTIKDIGKYYQDFFKDFSMERYENLITDMDLNMTLKLKTLSSGMMAKLKIAATMARQAKVYLLDEPLNGIDLLARDQVMKAIVTYADEDNILVISSHLVEELEMVADTAVFFSKAKLVGFYDLDNMRMEEGISVADKYREIYGKMSKEA